MTDIKHDQHMHRKVGVFKEKIHQKQYCSLSHLYGYHHSHSKTETSKTNWYKRYFKIFDTICFLSLLIMAFVIPRRAAHLNWGGRKCNNLMQVLWHNPCCRIIWTYYVFPHFGIQNYQFLIKKFCEESTHSVQYKKLLLILLDKTST